MDEAKDFTLLNSNWITMRCYGSNQKQLQCPVGKVCGENQNRCSLANENLLGRNPVWRKISQWIKTRKWNVRSAEEINVNRL